MNKLVSGAIGVEIILKYGAKNYLPDLADLRNKRIKHIDVCDPRKAEITPSGYESVILGYSNDTFMTITEQNTGKELIRDLPVSELSNTQNRLFVNKIIDLQRSYITVSESLTHDAYDGKCLYLVFWYDEPAVWGVMNTNERTAILPFEITLSAALKTYFPENRDMLNKRIQNILLNFPGITPTGKIGLEESNLKNKYITLQRNGLQFFYRVPLYLFYQAYSAYPLRLQNIAFDFQSSFIENMSYAEDNGQTIFFNAIIDDNKPVHHNK